MSPDEAQPMVEATAEMPAKPIRRQQFRRSSVGIPPDAAIRQGRVTTMAWQALGGRDAALAFLNTHDDELGGRPIDLAVAGEDGLAAVEAVMRERAAALQPGN